jgi:hypothetical protein
MPFQYICPQCEQTFISPSRRLRVYCSYACRDRAGSTRTRLTPEEVYARHVIVNEDGCWGWQGATNYGYGIFTAGRKNYRAHIFAYTMRHGPIPQGMCVCHTCDVRTCTRDEHLWLGTRDDNQLDMMLKGRAPRGERSGGAKLTDERVRFIRRIQFVSHRQIIDLAAEWGVSYGTIWQASRFKTWRHVR